MKKRNYPDQIDIPTRFVLDTESEDVESKLKAWEIAYNCGVKTKAADWYQMIGASKPEPEDEVISNEGQGGEAPGQEQPGRPAQVQGGLDVTPEHDAKQLAGMVGAENGEDGKPARYA